MPLAQITQLYCAAELELAHSQAHIVVPVPAHAQRLIRSGWCRLTCVCCHRLFLASPEFVLYKLEIRPVNAIVSTYFGEVSLEMQRFHIFRRNVSKKEM